MKKLIIRFHKKLTTKDYKIYYTITHMSLRFPANLIPYANTIIPNKVGKMSVKM